jgi:hypothetical protein
MSEHERAEHDAILKWCRGRDYRPLDCGMPAMRDTHDKLCAVVDVARHDSRRVAVGRDWIEVAAKLREKGAKL